MSYKKIIAYLIFIIVLIYVPDFVYRVGSLIHFVNVTYLLYYGIKVLVVYIALFMLFIEVIKHIE